MTDLRSLIPSSKDDLDRATEIVRRGYPDVAPIVPELFEWLQDYNWPVAHVLAPFLASIGAPLLPDIRRVLATKDEIWKYWVLTCLVQTSEMAVGLRDELTRLADQPSKEQASEGLPVIAREILDRYT